MPKPSIHSALLAALLASALLSACGGGGDEAAKTSATSTFTPTPEAGAPSASGNTTQDGISWINFRRGQLGVPALTVNDQVSAAAKAHSDYLRLNNTVSHNETAGSPGYTGSDLLQRLAAAGYTFGTSGYVYGEVISATSNSSGFYMAEELITAIYHRFVMFEPRFKEIGAGAASSGNGYTYMTADFTARNGFGPGIGRGIVVNWPYDGQKAVVTNFYSDYESPDPVPNANEVGYPISVHADIGTNLTIQNFSVRPRGGADLPVKLLSATTDTETKAWTAAIVPLAVLKGATTYDVSFVGSADGVPVSKTWSFTTK